MVKEPSRLPPSSSKRFTTSPTRKSESQGVMWLVVPSVPQAEKSRTHTDVPGGLKVIEPSLSSENTGVAKSHCGLLENIFLGGGRFPRRGLLGFHRHGLCYQSSFVGICKPKLTRAKK